MAIISKSFKVGRIFTMFSLGCFLGLFTATNYCHALNFAEREETQKAPPSSTIPAQRFTSDLPFNILVEEHEGDNIRTVGRTPGTVEIPECVNCIFFIELEKADVSDYAEEIQKKKIGNIFFYSIDDEKLVALKKSGCLDQVEKLELVGSISDLKPLENLLKLKELSLGGLKEVNDLSPLSSLPNLSILALMNCSKIKDLTPLVDLPNLKSLIFNNAENISDLKSLSRLKKLTDLQFFFSPKLKDLTPLSDMTNLKSLTFGKCDSLSDLTPLANLNSLELLNLTNCKQISESDISDLQKKLPKLKIVR